MIKKHGEKHTEKKQRIKRRAARRTTTKVVERFTRRNKLNKPSRSGGRKKTVGKVFDTTSTTAPRFTTERANDDDDDYDKITRQRYADYISKVAHAIAKERGMKISKQYVNKDIEDMIEFQLKLTEVNVYYYYYSLFATSLRALPTYAY